MYRIILNIILTLFVVCGLSAQVADPPVKTRKVQTDSIKARTGTTIQVVDTMVTAKEKVDTLQSKTAASWLTANDSLFVNGRFNVGLGLIYGDVLNTRVGFGTATPSYDYEFYQPGSGVLRIYANAPSGTNSSAGMTFINRATSTTKSWTWGAGIGASKAAFTLKDDVSSRDVIHFWGTGGASIGSTTQNGWLAVGNASQFGVDSLGNVLTSGTLRLSALTSGGVPFPGVDGTLRQNNSSFFWDSTNARLGIGTSSPSTSLHVSGGAAFIANTGQVTIGGDVGRNIEIKGSAGTSTYIDMGDSTSDDKDWRIQSAAGNNPNLTISTADSGNLILSPKVGIGTSSPTTAGSLQIAVLDTTKSTVVIATPNAKAATWDNQPIAALRITVPTDSSERNFVCGLWVETNGKYQDKGRGAHFNNYGNSDAIYVQNSADSASGLAILNTSTSGSTTGIVVENQSATNIGLSVRNRATGAGAVLVTLSDDSTSDTEMFRLGSLAATGTKIGIISRMSGSSTNKAFVVKDAGNADAFVLKANDGQISTTSKIGIGTTAPFDKVSMYDTASENTFNMTATNINTTVSSLAQAKDTSSIWAGFTNTGKPVIDVKGITGSRAFYVDSAGRVLINTENSSYPFELSSNTNPIVVIRSAVASGSSGSLNFIKSRGSLTAQTFALSGDALAVIGGGSDSGGTDVLSKGRIAITAGENWSSTAQGTNIIFSTTANTTTTRSDIMTIGNNGVVTLANATGRNITGTGTDSKFERNTASSAAYAITLLKTRSGSAANNSDQAGSFAWNFKNGTNTEVSGGAMYAIITDTTSSSEDMDIRFQTRVAGTTADRIYMSGTSLGIGTNSFGTSAVKTLSVGGSTAPSSSPADVAQLWAADINGTGGQHGFHIRNEINTASLILPGVRHKTDTGDPTDLFEGMFVINTADNTFKVYAEGALRTLVTW